MSALWKSQRELQMDELRPHSAEAQALALLPRCEIIKAILDRSVGKAWGVSSKWIEQSIRNALHSPGSPVYWPWGSNLQLAPLIAVGGAGGAFVVGGGAAGPGLVTYAIRSRSWVESWPMCTATAVWNSSWRTRRASWVRRTSDTRSASAGSMSGQSILSGLGRNEDSGADRER